MRFLAIVCAVMVGLGAVAHADEPTTQQRIAISAKPSVVKIVGAYTATFEVNGQQGEISIGGTGTGWFLTSDGYIATNAHVVSDIAEGEAKAISRLDRELLTTIDKQTGGKLSKLSPQELEQFKQTIKRVDLKAHRYVVLPNGDTLDYEIKQYGKPGTGGDCAIIKVKIENAPTLGIGDSRRSQVGDQIVVIGYPGAADAKGLLDTKSALQPTVTDGVISALKGATTGEQILQISAPITHGNSGGPAIDQHGNVVGLATFATDVQGFNFLVASATLMELVKAEKIEPKPSDTNKAWNTGLDHYWANEYSDAIASFEEVQLLFPQHYEASNMIAASNRAKKDGKEKQPSNTAAIVGFLIGATALVLAMTSVARRRRQALRHRHAYAGIPMHAGPAMAAPLPVASSPPRPMYGAPHHPAPNAAIATTVAIESARQPPAAIPATVFGSFSIGSLTCMRGPLQGQRFALTATGVVVGRQPGVAHLLVNDHRASGKHVWIGMERGQLVAIDQGTTNGTYINDVTRGRITRAELRDGDVVIVGDPDCCSLQVRFG